MIRDEHFLGKGGLDIEYLKTKKMSKTIFIRNKLYFGDTSSIDDRLDIKEQFVLCQYYKNLRNSFQ